jgi:hypothetical protein
MKRSSGVCRRPQLLVFVDGDGVQKVGRPRTRRVRTSGPGSADRRAPGQRVGLTAAVIQATRYCDVIVIASARIAGALSLTSLFQPGVRLQYP